MTEKNIQEAVESSPKDPNVIREFKLPASGKHVTVMKATGREYIKAKIKVGGKYDELDFAIASEIMLFDGKKMMYEDILDMDISDVIKIDLEAGKLLAGIQGT